MKMMQSMLPLLKLNNFNALVIFLTLILFDQFCMVFNITVNPIDTIDPASSVEYNFNSGEVHSKKSYMKRFESSELYDLNNIDHAHFDGPFGSSPEVIDAGSFGQLPPFPPSNGRLIVKDPVSDESSDAFGNFMKMFSFYHTLFELPSLFNGRVSIRQRIVSKPPLPVPQKQIATSPLASITEGLKDKLKAIYPGTLWCGDGNQARNKNEIGLFRNTDICCKQHDQCPSFIRSGAEFKGLRNTGLFTRSHCECDQKFYNCLKKTDSLVSNKIGYTYFNILRPQCFRKEFPVIGCRKWINKKCYIYMVDDEKPPSWQWFDNNLF